MAGPDSGSLSDLLAQLADLQRAASDLSTRLHEAEAAASEASGRDPSEQVRVTLTGVDRVKAVEVSPDWRSRLKVQELGSAVLAAAREAARHRAETWAGELGRTDGTAGSDDDSGGPASATWSATAGFSPSDSESIRGLWYLLQDATDRLDDLASETASRGRATTTGRDAVGHVTVTLTGGELSDVHLDPAWSARAGGREIGTAITAALMDGYAAIDSLAERSLIRQWPFPDLERYASDPTALLTALGLPTPHLGPDQQR